MRIPLTELTNTSRTIYKGPALLYSITISGDGAAGDCDVYDGVNSQGERKYHLEVGAGATVVVSLQNPVELDRGLYVKVNAATTFVTVQYEPLKEPID